MGQPSKVKDDPSWNYLLTDTHPRSYVPVQLQLETSYQVIKTNQNRR